MKCKIESLKIPTSAVDLKKESEALSADIEEKKIKFVREVFNKKKVDKELIKSLRLDDSFKKEKKKVVTKKTS